MVLTDRSWRRLRASLLHPGPYNLIDSFHSNVTGSRHFVGRVFFFFFLNLSNVFASRRNHAVVSFRVTALCEEVLRLFCRKIFSEQTFGSAGGGLTERHGALLANISSRASGVCRAGPLRRFGARAILWKLIYNLGGKVIFFKILRHIGRIWCIYTRSNFTIVDVALPSLHSVLICAPP